MGEVTINFAHLCPCCTITLRCKTDTRGSAQISVKLTPQKYKPLSSHSTLILRIQQQCLILENITLSRQHVDLLTSNGFLLAVSKTNQKYIDLK